MVLWASAICFNFNMDKDFFERIKDGSVLLEGAPYIIHKRRWGFSVVLDANTRIHFINGECSAHFHRYRTEDYILYTGEIEVFRGEFYEEDLEKTVANLKRVKMVPGDRIVIPPKTVHIPINMYPGGSVFFEISHGPYAEEDIERIYDKNCKDPKLAKKWSGLGYKKKISIKDLIPLIKK